MSLLGVEAASKPSGSFSFESSLPETFPDCPSFATRSLAHEESGYPILRAGLPVDIVGIYGIGNHASYPHVHKLLSHTDTLLQAYAPLDALDGTCPMKDMPSVCMFFDLRTGLDRLRLLASHDGTYIMTVNADDTATDFPPCKQSLSLYENLSDYGKPLLVIPCISERDTVLPVNPVPLHDEYFKAPGHAVLGYPCP